MSPTQWPQFQADALKSRFTETPGPVEGSVAWRFDTGESGVTTATPPATGTPFDGPPSDARDNAVSSPAVVDGTVYVGSHDGQLHAIGADSGEAEWTFETDGNVFASPTYRDETLYVGSQSGSMYAVDRDSGDELFSVDADDDILSSPAGAVFDGSSDSRVYAVGDPTGGESLSATPPGTTDSPGTAPTDGSCDGTTSDDGTDFGALGALAGLGLGAWQRVRAGQSGDDE